MNKVCRETKYVLGGLTVFAVWLFVVLPAAYSQTAQNRESTEFWPAIFGYRLKVIDTLIALFTFCLFLATLYLWRATKQLVDGARMTAEQQLRAYIYIRKTNFKLMRRATGTLAIGLKISGKLLPTTSASSVLLRLSIGNKADRPKYRRPIMSQL
jgi:hypothetical protein